MSIFGFTFFIMGMLSLVLSLIGIHLTFLGFLEIWGRLTGFLLKLVIIVTGFILIFLSKSEYPSNRG